MHTKNLCFFLQLKSDVVTQKQFDSLQVRVEKLEGAGANKGGSSQEVRAWHLQLDRLDPANKSLAFHGICDINLARRTLKLEAILVETTGCPKPVCVEHVHKGKQGERSPTKVSLIEFRNRSDRELALQLLTGKVLQDDTGAHLACKRARTNMQRQRNDELVKANDALKLRCQKGEKVEIDWKERRVLVSDMPAFVQSRETVEGSFLPPFIDVIL